MKPATRVAVTFLPGETIESRLTAIRSVRALGFEPKPHFSARRLESFGQFETYLSRCVDEGEVKRCFVIAGDPSEPEGCFHDISDLIESGLFERYGI